MKRTVEVKDEAACPAEPDAKRVKTEEHAEADSILVIDANEFECVVCYDLLVDPVVGRCGHDFCKTCLEDWMHQQQQTGALWHRHSTCPVCRKDIGVSNYSSHGQRDELGVCIRLKELVEKMFPKRSKERRREVDAEAGVRMLRREQQRQEQEQRVAARRANLQQLFYDQPHHPQPLGGMGDLAATLSLARIQDRLRRDTDRLRAESTGMGLLRDRIVRLRDAMSGADAPGRESDSGHVATVGSAEQQLRRSQRLRGAAAGDVAADAGRAAQRSAQSTAPPPGQQTAVLAPAGLLRATARHHATAVHTGRRLAGGAPREPERGNTAVAAAAGTTSADFAAVQSAAEAATTTAARGGEARGAAAQAAAAAAVVPQQGSVTAVGRVAELDTLPEDVISAAVFLDQARASRDVAGDGAHRAEAAAADWVRGPDWGAVVAADAAAVARQRLSSQVGARARELQMEDAQRGQPRLAGWNFYRSSSNRSRLLEEADLFRMHTTQVEHVETLGRLRHHWPLTRDIQTHQQPSWRQMDRTTADRQQSADMEMDSRRHRQLQPSAPAAVAAADAPAEDALLPAAASRPIAELSGAAMHDVPQLPRSTPLLDDELLPLLEDLVPLDDWAAEGPVQPLGAIWQPEQRVQELADTAALTTPTRMVSNLQVLHGHAERAAAAAGAASHTTQQFQMPQPGRVGVARNQRQAALFQDDWTPVRGPDISRAALDAAEGDAAVTSEVLLRRSRAISAAGATRAAAVLRQLRVARGSYALAAGDADLSAAAATAAEDAGALGSDDPLGDAAVSSGAAGAAAAAIGMRSTVAAGVCADVGAQQHSTEAVMTSTDGHRAVTSRTRQRARFMDGIPGVLRRSAHSDGQEQHLLQHWNEMSALRLQARAEAEQLHADVRALAEIAAANTAVPGQAATTTVLEDAAAERASRPLERRISPGLAATAVAVAAGGTGFSGSSVAAAAAAAMGVGSAANGPEAVAQRTTEPQAAASSHPNALQHQASGELAREVARAVARQVRREVSHLRTAPAPTVVDGGYISSDNEGA